MEIVFCIQTAIESEQTESSIVAWMLNEERRESMSQGQANYRDLREELTDVHAALGDAVVRKLIKDLIREEYQIAQEILTEPEITSIDTGTIQKKVDDVVSRIWDWVKRRREIPQ